MDFSQLIYIIPPILAVLLVIITRKPILSLSLSILSGLIILYGFNINLITNSFQVIYKVLTSLWNIKLVLGLLLLGGFIGIVEMAIHNKNIKLSRYFLNKKRVLFMGWISGLLFFIDDYFNILFNGVFLKSITRKHKISKAKLAFIIHSLGVSACVIIPFSTWTVYIVSIIKNMGIENGYGIFLDSIPYDFYAISLIFITLAVILYEINILGMKKEEQEYKIEYSTKSKSNDISLKQLLFPAVLLVAISMLFLILNIIWIMTNKASNISDIISQVDFTNILLLSGFIGCSIVGLYYYKKGFNPKKILNSFVFGGKQMSSAVIILILAWLMGEITVRLNTTQVIINYTQGFLSNGILVLSAFVITAVLSFMTSSWATFAVSIPIMLPLAFASGVDPAIILGAIVSGGVFGDHTSPVSSTTILTKAVSKIDIGKHFHTQLPYSMIAFVISAYLFVLMGGFA